MKGIPKLLNSVSINSLFKVSVYDSRIYFTRSWEYLFSVIRVLSAGVVSVIFSMLMLEFFGFLVDYDQSYISLPFWFFFVLFSCSFFVSNYIMHRLWHLARSDLIFHIVFVLVVLNIVGAIVHMLGFYVYSWVYFSISGIYLFLVTFLGTYLLGFGIGVLGIYLVLYNLVAGFEIFLVLSNSVVYKVARRRRRLKRRFFHGFVPSIAPAQHLITLFYKQFGDTIFVWDYSIFGSVLVYSGLSFLAFYVFSSFYHHFVRASIGMRYIQWFGYTSIAIGLASGCMYIAGSFLVLTNLPYLPVSFIEFWTLLARVGQNYDYQSYILFLCYAAVLYLIARSWVSIMRWFIFQIVRREYVIDLDYKSIKPIIYGWAPFPLFWKFPKYWVREILNPPAKPFRRSTPPEQPDDAVYYYGGPHPNMVIFNPYTGSVIFLLVRDLIHENYRVYYKLYTFAKRKFPIQLFPILERNWSVTWLFNESRKSRARRLLSLAPYYYYAREDLDSDYWLNRFLVMEDATKDNSDEPSMMMSEEDEEKSFFDSYLWESVWLKGFGRSLPSCVPADVVQYNFLNPAITKGWAGPGPFPVQVREDYQDLLMFRRRYLFRQALHIHQSIGLIPSEVYTSSVLFDCGSRRLLNQVHEIGIRNLILANISEYNSCLSLFKYFGVRDYLLNLIYKLQIRYFSEAQQFIFERSFFDQLWILLRPFSFFSSSLKDQFIAYTTVTKFIYRELVSGLSSKFFASSMFQMIFLDYCNKLRLERGLSQSISMSQLRPVPSLLVQLGSFGFYGLDLRRKLDEQEQCQLLRPVHFSNFDRPLYSFERILLSLTSYDFLITQPREFYGIFETMDINRSNSQQGRFDRFCFVDSRVLLDNEQKSKLNNFFVDLNTWTIKFGGFEYEKSEHFEVFRRYLDIQNFMFGSVVYHRFRSSAQLFIYSLGLGRDGGLEPFDIRSYRFGIMNPGPDLSIVSSNPNYLDKEERIYRKLPFIGFVHSTLADWTLGSNEKALALSNFSVLGLDIPLSQMRSPRDSFYSNSFLAHSFYSHVFSCVNLGFSFSNLASIRFRIPMFYSVFDSWFSNSIFQRSVLNSGISNCVSSNYIKNVTHKLFRVFNTRFLVIRYSDLYWEFRWRAESWMLGGRLPVETWLRFVVHGHVSPMPRYYGARNYDLPVSYRFRLYTTAHTWRSSFMGRNNFSSRRWVYNWGLKFLRPAESAAKFEYYSSTRYPRAFESFPDRSNLHHAAYNLVPTEANTFASKFWLYVTDPLSKQFPRSRVKFFLPRYLGLT